MFPSISLQLGSMRKSQNFTLMRQSDGRILGQSDKRIFVLDTTLHSDGTATMILGGPKGNSFMDLSSLRGAKLIKVDREILTKCQEELAPVDPNGSTSLGGGVVHVHNTVQVVS